MRVPEFKNVEEMQNFLDVEKKNGATVLQPSDLTPISYYRPVIETVSMTSDDYYKTQGKCRLHYSGLTKLGNAAGVEWLPADTCRTDNRSDKMYVSFRAVGGIRKNDGRLYPMKAEYDLDLEIIEEETRDSYISKGQDKKLTGQALEDYVNSNTKRDVIQKRKRKLTLAESGAKSRVLRALLNIPGNYNNEDQVKSIFIVVRFVLDHQNPDIKKLFLETAKMSMLGLYGREPQTLPVSQNYLGDIDDAIDIPNKDNNAPPTEREQFIQYDAATQGAILSQLSKKEAFNIEKVLEDAKITSPDQLPEERRIKFYDFLTKDKAA